MNRGLTFLLLLTLLVGTPVWAKRMPAPKVSPLVYHGVRYVAPNRDGFTGYVQAWDVRTGQMLWQRVVYRVRLRPRLEEDVQARFITGLRAEGDTLWVTREGGQLYALNLRTGRVKVLASGKAQTHGAA